MIIKVKKGPQNGVLVFSLKVLKVNESKFLNVIFDTNNNSFNINTYE